MLEAFYPGQYVESAYKIPYEKLYRQGICGIIFDVDNTLAVSYTHLPMSMAKIIKKTPSPFRCYVI